MDPQISQKALEDIANELKQHRSREEYTASVIALIKLALNDTSGSRAAAQVLLSAYNGDNWQLNVTDLVCLDRENLQHALVVMECRAMLWEEPHNMVTNGSELFERLQRRWRRMHIDNRWKNECQRCYGSGLIYLNEHDEYDERMTTCSHCSGKGLLASVGEF